MKLHEWEKKGANSMIKDFEELLRKANIKANELDEQYKKLDKLSFEEKINLILNSKIIIEPAFIDEGIGLLVEFI